MKFIQLSCLAVTLAGLSAVPAAADPVIYRNFCPGDPTCPAGVEASLTFNEGPDGGDPNDYIVTLTITGDALAPAYVDEVSFKIDSAQVSDYEALPSLLKAPSEGGPWLVFFDNISGSATSCVANTGQQQAICSQSGPGSPSNYGALLQGETLKWIFTVDLKDSEGALSFDSAVNLRSQFLTSSGKNAGILSPVGVSEGSSMFLLGSGLLALAAATRCRRADASSSGAA